MAAIRTIESFSFIITQFLFINHLHFNMIIILKFYHKNFEDLFGFIILILSLFSQFSVFSSFS